MLELHQVIRDVTDPSVVMRRVVDQALHVIPNADGAAVELLDPGAGELRYVCSGGTLAHALGLRLRAATSLSGRAIAAGTTLRCDDAEADDRVDLTACRRAGARSLLCLPLGRTLGVLKVTSSRTHAFTDDDVATLARLAEFVTVSIGAAADLARIAGEVSGWNSRASSEFVANVLNPTLVPDADARGRVQAVLDADALTVAVQPIFALPSGLIVGAEALARFPDDRTPDRWFADAHRAGLGVALELAAVRHALAVLPALPPDAFLTINVGPDAIAARELPELLEAGGAPARIVLELTEHLQVQDYARLRRALDGLRERGTRLAIDDTGAGYASLAHILKLAPDIIKLDRGLARDIDADPVRRALAAALVTFAARTGAHVVAEGLETAGERDAVRGLGIAYGQGFLLGRPGTPAALAPPHADAA
jgi:EAL domain-containing protein (putative c-di-GMP-specific phosphodiesterase class I)